MAQLRLPTKCEGGLDLVENHFAHDISRVNVDSADRHHLSSFSLIWYQYRDFLLSAALLLRESQEGGWWGCWASRSVSCSSPWARSRNPPQDDQTTASPRSSTQSVFQPGTPIKVCRCRSLWYLRDLCRVVEEPGLPRGVLVGDHRLGKLGTNGLAHGAHQPGAKIKKKYADYPTCQLSPVQPDLNLVFADASSGEGNVLPILDGKFQTYA